jgi:protein SCO1/2
MIALLMFAAMLSACGEQKLPSPFHASDVSSSFQGADFRLTDGSGNQRTLGDFRGKVVAIFFGYTHCPDLCPTTMADLALAMTKLGKDEERVQVLFVTVDPERDTPELLAQYVSAFDPRFLGLSGDERATAHAAGAFQVKYQKQQTASGYSVDHSVGIYLVDPSGRVRLRTPYGESSAWIADDIRLLLAGI